MAIKGAKILSDSGHGGTSTIPMSDSRVHRIDFDVSELGARKSHTGKINMKNGNGIQHVKGG